MLFKSINRVVFIALDVFAFICSYFACLLIIDEFSFVNYSAMLLIIISSISVSKVILNYLFKSYNHLWEYGNKLDYFILILFNLVLNLVVLVIVSIVNAKIQSVIEVNVLIFSILCETLYLFTSRIIYSRIKRKQKGKPSYNLKNKKTMIVGAGSAGVMILNEQNNNENINFDVIGFIDDDPKKIGAIINGKRVYGPISEINTFTKKFKVTDLIIALPSVPDARIKEIVSSINYKDMNVMIMPSFAKILRNDFNQTLRKISISDMLGRNPIQLNGQGISEFIDGKTILVTGAGGSIGSELCRQIMSYSPKKLIMFDIYENTVYSLSTELDMKYQSQSGTEKKYIALIGSVRDEQRLEEIFALYKPQIVFHAAAHKHVPLMERSPKEAIKNNITGTYNVSKAADKYQCDKLVLISTDKAVNPTNVMGASKRICEMVVEAFNAVSKKTRYSMVRFGNVLGSNGSVIPLFEKQIASGGPVTVTHPEINRFFMTIAEACSLVIQAGAFAKGGEKFILDMGEPVKIIDLAKKMIQLSGLILDTDISIEITGLRPGEKLYEELLLDVSTATKTENEKIFVETDSFVFSLKEIESIIENALKILDGNEENRNKLFLNFLNELEEKRTSLV